MMSRGWKMLVALLALVPSLLAGCDRGTEDANANGTPERPPAVVELAQVETATLEETVRGVGTLRASATVVISPEIAGRVSRIAFEEGGRVEQGQTLVELVDEKLGSQLAARRAALRAAEARAENAQTSFQRQQELRERGIVSQQEYDQALAERDAARAEVERLRAEVALVEAQLGDSRIVAPFAGLISERQVDQGAYVNSGDPLATLYRVDPLEVEFNVPERHAGRVQNGQPVSLSVAAWPGESFAGEVVFVSPAIREATRDFLVKAQVSNPEGRLRPGGFATALVTVGVREGRPMVPEEALVATRRGYLIFVVKDGVARMREVEIGMRREGMAEVVSGLAAGETIVRRGHLRLSGGERVTGESAAATPAPAGEGSATP